MAQELNGALRYDTEYLQIISDISGLPTVLWSEDTMWVGGDVAEHPCQTDSTMRPLLESGCPNGKPGIYLENENVFWGVMRLGRHYIAIGPAASSRTGDDAEKKYALHHNMTQRLPLSYVPYGDMTKYLALLSCHFFGSTVRYDEIEMRGMGSEHLSWQSEASLEHYQLSQSEYDRGHKSGMSYENDMLMAVREGDVERVKQLMGANLDIGKMGQVAPEAHKQMEYMAVSLLTLLTRAAVEGGMHPEAAYELGDIYLNRLAGAVSTGGGVTPLGLRAMVEFAEQVRKAKAERSHASHVEACKAYVEQNLRKDIKVTEIAPALGISRTHLAHLFKETEGISLQLYIQREKCRHAERLLKYSDYPVSLISEYFGFSSPSYFSTCFEHWYGVSPARYRRVNARK